MSRSLLPGARLAMEPSIQRNTSASLLPGCFSSRKPIQHGSPYFQLESVDNASVTKLGSLGVANKDLNGRRSDERCMSSFWNLNFSPSIKWLFAEHPSNATVQFNLSNLSRRCLGVRMENQLFDCEISKEKKDWIKTKLKTHLKTNKLSFTKGSREWGFAVFNFQMLNHNSQKV